MAISDEIIATIKYALERQTLKYDQTFLSTVEKVNSDGTYTVRDNSGATRNVKCSIPSLTPKTGQSVYVCIPSGNLNRIHICGIV